MAVSSRSFNCEILWTIENYPLLLSLNKCVPIAEVVTFNLERWKLELIVQTELPQVSFKMTKLSGDQEMPTDRKVSFVNNDGADVFEGNCLRNKSDTEKVLQFDFRCRHDCQLQDGGVIRLKIQLRFLVGDLLLRTAVRTIFKTETCSFRWYVRDVYEGANDLQYPIPIHLPGSPQLILYFIVKKNNKNEYFYNLGLKNNNSVPSPLESDCSPKAAVNDLLVFCVIDDDEKNCIKGNVLFSNHTPNTHEVELKLNQHKNNINLNCRFRFCAGESESIQLETVYSSPNSGNSVIMDDFQPGKPLFKNMRFSDVTLKTGSREFKAHKSVLSSSSPVFSAMFDNEMSEAATGVVDIGDIDPVTLKKMLKFIYTSEIDDWSFDQHEKLLAAANKYTILSLRSLCSRHLVSLLTEKTVIRVLHLGYLHNDETMKNAAKSYFCAHPLILNSREWNDYMEQCFPGEAASWTNYFTVEKLKKSLESVKLSIPPSVSAFFPKRDEKDIKKN